MVAALAGFLASYATGFETTSVAAQDDHHDGDPVSDDGGEIALMTVTTMVTRMAEMTRTALMAVTLTTMAVVAETFTAAVEGRWFLTATSVGGSSTPHARNVADISMVTQHSSRGLRFSTIA
jgi:hypothetical protein